MSRNRNQCARCVRNAKADPPRADAEQAADPMVAPAPQSALAMLTSRSVREYERIERRERRPGEDIESGEPNA